MKKFFLFIVIAFAAIGVNAQKTTYIAKVGGGIGGDEFAGILANAGFEVNFPISTTRWTFSPSLHGALCLDDSNDGQSAIYMPLAFGYKASLGNRWIFRPTLGPMVGYAIKSSNDEEGGMDGGLIAGPFLGLNFESTHFSIGLQGFYSFTRLVKKYYGYNYSWRNDYNYTGAYLTLGYKF